jgi:hypothetical protein
MLTIRNLELSRTYINGDWRKPKYATKAEVKIGKEYSATAHVTLTDEQTDKAVAFIVELIRESLSVELEVPAPVEEAPALPDPLPVAEAYAGMEPL